MYAIKDKGSNCNYYAGCTATLSPMWVQTPADANQFSSEREGKEMVQALTKRGVLSGGVEVVRIIPQYIMLQGRRWWDGQNTYHSCTVYVNGLPVGSTDIDYGYGDQYIQSGFDWLKRAGYLPDWHQDKGSWQYCKDNDIVFARDCVDVGRKRDL